MTLSAAAAGDLLPKGRNADNPPSHAKSAVPQLAAPPADGCRRGMNQSPQIIPEPPHPPTQGADGVLPMHAVRAHTIFMLHTPRAEVKCNLISGIRSMHGPAPCQRVLVVAAPT